MGRKTHTMRSFAFQRGKEEEVTHLGVTPVLGHGGVDFRRRRAGHARNGHAARLGPLLRWRAASTRGWPAPAAARPRRLDLHRAARAALAHRRQPAINRKMPNQTPCPHTHIYTCNWQERGCLTLSADRQLRSFNGQGEINVFMSKSQSHLA